ncbi:MAG: flagellar hook-length control protein FliK [Candidatus Puniceispirillaceae bacterium]
MFADLFGGATGETSSEELLIGKVSMTATVSEDFGEANSSDEQTNDELNVIMASMHGGRGLGQKFTGHQDDASNDELELEKGLTSSDSENSDAVALMASSALLPETQGGTAAVPRSALLGMANMVFEDGVDPNARPGSAVANVISKNPAGSDGNSLLGRNQNSIEFIGPQKVQQSGAKIGENLGVKMENPLTKNMTSDLVKLKALRAANLEQQNADIDEESLKADLGELNNKSGKNGLTVTSLKQQVVSSANPSFNFKVQSLSEAARTANDGARVATASPTAFESAPVITGTGANATSTGQSGAHGGHQGSAQSGSQSGGGLLGNLNNLQILDTAKDNWTEMLLQRVKNGLSGGTDHLDFQLNPRNLGKMRISLVMQNDRTNIQIQTETSAAASMLNDSESRLAQMLEASGLRLGTLNSGQFQGFGGAGSDQQANQQNQSKTGSLKQPDDVQGEVVDELVNEGSDNLINIQA